MILYSNYCSTIVFLAIFVSTFTTLFADMYNIQDGKNANNHPSTFTFYNMSHHIRYRLYTRDSPDGTLLNRNDVNMVEDTSFDTENPIKIIVPGWLGNKIDKNRFCMRMVKAYLKFGEYNVICVDWSQTSIDVIYPFAKMRAKFVGYDIAKVVEIITKKVTGGVKNVHLIGNSMGVHVVGFTGKKLNGQIGRITGCDPSKPLYGKSGPTERIDKNDAQFVDILHTGASGIGLLQSLGHVDYYPNGGTIQPGCNNDICSHLRASQYFANSIWAKENYKAYECSSWTEFLRVNSTCANTNSTYMGEHVDKKRTGDYYLEVYED